MPRQKKTPDKNNPPKKKRPRKGSIHPKLAHLAGACIGVEDGAGTLAESELAGITADRCLLYRVGPKSVTNGKRVFLHTFGYYPEISEIKELFGGGEFWVQVYSDGGYAGGSPRIAIEGEPKLISESSPGKALDSLPSSSDPVVNVLMQTLMQFMDRMVEEIKELKADSPVASGLNPEKVRELVNAATEAQLTNRLILMATGGGQASPVDADEVAERRLKTMLDIFKMGIDAARDGGDGETTGGGFGGILNRFAPLLEKLVANSAMNAAIKPVGPPGQAVVDTIPTAPVIDVSEVSDPAAIEKDRENLEGKTQEFRTEMLIQRLRNGVSAMLDAFESDNEYDDEQICDFIMGAVPTEELALVRTYLTFDKVRMLSTSNAPDQIALDSNRDRVEIVLAKLVSRL
jgi:hypothetical protein